MVFLFWFIHVNLGMRLQYFCVVGKAPRGFVLCWPPRPLCVLDGILRHNQPGSVSLCFVGFYSEIWMMVKSYEWFGVEVNPWKNCFESGYQDNPLKPLQMDAALQLSRQFPKEKVLKITTVKYCKQQWKGRNYNLGSSPLSTFSSESMRGFIWSKLRWKSLYRFVVIDRITYERIIWSHCLAFMFFFSSWSVNCINRNLVMEMDEVWEIRLLECYFRMTKFFQRICDGVHYDPAEECFSYKFQWIRQLVTPAHMKCSHHENSNSCLRLNFWNIVLQ